MTHLYHDKTKCLWSHKNWSHHVFSYQLILIMWKCLESAIQHFTFIVVFRPKLEFSVFVLRFFDDFNLAESTGSSAFNHLYWKKYKTKNMKYLVISNTTHYNVHNILNFISFQICRRSCNFRIFLHWSGHSSYNHSSGEVYSIQHYVIKFVSDLWHVGGFLRVLRFPPPI
jgi:hypothetical protein